MSLATASLVLAGKDQGRIATATATSVRAAATSLGYVPNRLATGLARGRSATIGVIIPDLSNAFYAGIVEGIEAACDGADLRPLLSHGRNDPLQEQRAAQQLIAQQVDGLVVIAGDAGPAALGAWLMPLVQGGLSVVVVDEDDPALVVDSVTSDDHAGMAALVAHLVAKGHRRLGCIAAGDARSSARARLAGFQAGCRSAGIPADRVAGDRYEPDAAAAALAHLLDVPDPPTAVLAVSDHLAMVAWRTARQRGLRIPQDLALTGFADDRWLAPALELTTVDQQPALMGRSAVALLRDRIGTTTALAIRRRRLETRLVVRETG